MERHAPAAGRGAHFRSDVEGLRAIAVVVILLYHIGLPEVPGGFVGVDVFYVISGFLITGLIWREIDRTGGVDLVGFYARRMRRLLPASLLVIAVTVGMSSLLLSRLQFPSVAGDAAAAILYVSNIRFAMSATDYLASTEPPSPLLHTWSLGVEEQFYLVWPVLLLLASRVLPRAWVGWVLLAVAAASFGLSLVWTDVAAPWAFFSLPTRMWELAAGGLLAIGLVRWPHRAGAGTASLVGGVGLALLAIAALRIDADTPFPGTAALLPVAGTMLLILAGARPDAIHARLLSLRIPRWIGRISYSLYLWHWPLLILVPIWIGRDDLPTRILLVLVAVLLATASTELLEVPIREQRVLGATARQSFSVGLAVTGVLAAMAVGAGAVGPIRHLLPDPVLAVVETPDPTPTVSPVRDTPTPPPPTPATQAPAATLDPTVSPATPVATRTSTPTAAAVAIVTPIPTTTPPPGPTAAPTAAPTPTPPPGPTATLIAVATAAPTRNPTAIPAVSPTPAVTQTPTPTPTATPVAIPTPVATPPPIATTTPAPPSPPTATPTPTATPVAIPTPVATPPPIATTTPGPTPPPTATPTPTAAVVPVVTPPARRTQPSVTPAPAPTLPPTAPPPTVAPTPSAPPVPAPTSPVGSGRFDGRPPDALRPTLEEARQDLPLGYSDGCHLDFGTVTAPACTYGSTDPAAPLVMLIGDSHAAQWLPALAAVAEERQWRLTAITKSGCPFVDLTVWIKPLKRAYRECDAWREEIATRIAAEHPRVLVVAAAREYQIVDDKGRHPFEESLEAWRAALVRTLTAGASSADEVILIADTPRLLTDPVECLAARDRLDACPTPQEELVDESYLELEADAAAEAGASLLPAVDWLCDGDRCPLVMGDLLVYRDDQHLTATFARSLAGVMGAAIDANLADTAGSQP